MATLKDPVNKEIRNMPRQKEDASVAENTPLKAKLGSYGVHCRAFVTKKQNYCGKPTVLGKSVCAGHGGLSTGPRTTEGKARIAEAKTVHGRETRALRILRSQISHELRRLEEIMYKQGLIHGPRTRGRKPSLWAR
jgi:hypothetical protein